ncbi:MAG: response regulator [Thermoplasmata archaeon]|nr:response regulator [Thermoplasmata archaeon]
MNRAKEGKAIHVLLVEDDPGDVDLTLEVMDKSKLKIKMDVVDNGEDALGYLNQDSYYVDAPRPDLILLDLNMPRKDGREVLQDIKNDENLKSIPVIILTTSNANEDIIKCYTAGANCYITKPVGLEEFKSLMKSLESFWFTIVEFPHL